MYHERMASDEHGLYFERAQRSRAIDDARLVFTNESYIRRQVISNFLAKLVASPGPKNVITKGTYDIGPISAVLSLGQEAHNYAVRVFLEEMQDSKVLNDLEFFSHYSDISHKERNLIAAFSYTPTKLQKWLERLMKGLVNGSGKTAKDIHTKEDGKNGYLGLKENHILIGKIGTAKYRLAYALCMAYGVHRTIDSVYEIMQPEAKRLPDCGGDQSCLQEKYRAIETQFIEIQRRVAAHRDLPGRKNKKLPLEVSLLGSAKEGRIRLKAS